MRTIEEIKDALSKVTEDEQSTRELLNDTTKQLKFLTLIGLKEEASEIAKEGIETSMSLNTMRGVISGLKWVLKQSSPLDVILEFRQEILDGKACDTCDDRFDCDIIKEKQTIH